MSVYAWIVWDIIILRCMYIIPLVLLVCACYYFVIYCNHYLLFTLIIVEIQQCMQFVGEFDTLLTVEYIHSSGGYTLQCWVYTHSNVGYTLQCWVYTHSTFRDGCVDLRRRMIFVSTFEDR